MTDIDKLVERVIKIMEDTELTRNKREGAKQILSIPISEGKVCDRCKGTGRGQFYFNCKADCDDCKGTGWAVPPVTIDDAIKEKLNV